MLSEIKQDINWRTAIFQILCLVLLFSTSVGYVDEKGKGSVIFQLLLDTGDGSLISKGDIDGFELWSKGISAYSSVIYPILTSLCFSFSMYYEKRGARRNRLHREKRIRYCFVKVTGAVISSGVIFMTAYLLLGLVIRIRMLSRFPVFSANRKIILRCGLKLFYSFTYGMALSLFFVIVSIFFDDRYELMCIPILIKYMVMILSNRIGIMGAGSNGNTILQHVSEVALNPENLISNYSSLREKVESITVASSFYGISILLLYYRIKRDEKNGAI